MATNKPLKQRIPMPYRKGRLITDGLIGAHVVLKYQGRELLGVIQSIEYRDYPPCGTFLKVRHMNGESWPIEPNAGACCLLNREWDGAK